MPLVNWTMQVVLEDGVEVGGEEWAAKVAEVLKYIDVLSWALEQQHPQKVCINSSRNRHNLNRCLNSSFTRHNLNRCIQRSWNWISSRRCTRTAGRQQGLRWHWLILCDVLVIISTLRTTGVAGDVGDCDGIGNDTGVVKGIIPPEGCIPPEGKFHLPLEVDLDR